MKFRLFSTEPGFIKVRDTTSYRKVNTSFKRQVIMGPIVFPFDISNRETR